MSPTIFDAGAQKRQKKTVELERQLDEIKVQEKQRPSSTLPAREEAPIQEIHQMSHKESAPEAKAARTPADYSDVMKNLGSRGGLFSAFITQPQNVCFETQHTDEKILMLLRQHPIVNLKWILATILLIIGPAIVLSIFPFLAFLPAQFAVFASIGWYLFVFTFAIQGFLGWYYNIYIITDERIIDVDFYSLIYRSVSEAKLEKIEDVTSTMAGIGGTIFDYGTITIQTAAEKREFEFVDVPHPAQITKFLNEMILEEEREKIEGRVS